MITRRQLAAALLKPTCTSDEVIALGYALIAHGCSTEGATLLESIDHWRTLHPTMLRFVEEAIRQNWDNLRK